MRGGHRGLGVDDRPSGPCFCPAPATHEYLLARVTGVLQIQRTRLAVREKPGGQEPAVRPDPGGQQAHGGVWPTLQVAVALEPRWGWWFRVCLEAGAWGWSITGTPAAGTSSRGSREWKWGCSGPTRPGQGTVSTSHADHGVDTPWKSEPRGQGRAAWRDAPVGGGRLNPVTVASSCSQVGFGGLLSRHGGLVLSSSCAA